MKRYNSCYDPGSASAEAAHLGLESLEVENVSKRT